MRLLLNRDPKLRGGKSVAHRSHDKKKRKKCNTMCSRALKIAFYSFNLHGVDPKNMISTSIRVRNITFDRLLNNFEKFPPKNKKCRKLKFSKSPTTHSEPVKIKAICFYFLLHCHVWVTSLASANMHDSQSFSKPILRLPAGNGVGQWSKARPALLAVRVP